MQCSMQCMPINFTLLLTKFIIVDTQWAGQAGQADIAHWGAVAFTTHGTHHTHPPAARHLLHDISLQYCAHAPALRCYYSACLHSLHLLRPCGAEFAHSAAYLQVAPQHSSHAHSISFQLLATGHHIATRQQICPEGGISPIPARQLQALLCYLGLLSWRGSSARLSDRGPSDPLSAVLPLLMIGQRLL